MKLNLDNLKYYRGWRIERHAMTVEAVKMHDTESQATFSKFSAVSVDEALRHIDLIEDESDGE